MANFAEFVAWLLESGFGEIVIDEEAGTAELRLTEAGKKRADMHRKIMEAGGN